MSGGLLVEVEEEEVGVGWWWWLPCESAGDVCHDWRVQQHLERTTARIQRLHIKPYFQSVFVQQQLKQ